MYYHTNCHDANITGTDFHWLIPDDDVDPAKVKKLLFCSGKVYYELAKVTKTLITGMLMVRIN